MDYLLGILTLPALFVAVFVFALVRECTRHIWAMAVLYGPWRPAWVSTARRAGGLLARGETYGFSAGQWGRARRLREHARTAVRFGRWPLVLWPPFVWVGFLSWIDHRERQ